MTRYWPEMFLEHLGVVAVGALIAVVVMSSGLAWIVYRLRKDTERRA